MSHNYEDALTDEDPRMIALFDSLVERTENDWAIDNHDSSEEDSDNPYAGGIGSSTRMQRIIWMLFESGTSSPSAVSTPSLPSSLSASSLSASSLSTSENEDEQTDDTVGTTRTGERRSLRGRPELSPQGVDVNLGELRRIFRRRREIFETEGPVDTTTLAGNNSLEPSLWAGNNDQDKTTEQYIQNNSTHLNSVSNSNSLGIRNTLPPFPKKHIDLNKRLTETSNGVDNTSLPFRNGGSEDGIQHSTNSNILDTQQNARIHTYSTQTLTRSSTSESSRHNGACNASGDQLKVSTDETMPAVTDVNQILSGEEVHGNTITNDTVQTRETDPSSSSLPRGCSTCSIEDNNKTNKSLKRKNGSIKTSEISATDGISRSPSSSKEVSMNGVIRKSNTDSATNSNDNVMLSFKKVNHSGKGCRQRNYRKSKHH